MIKVNNSCQIYFALEPIDMRKAIDGLAYIISGSENKDPQNGDLYVFRNKSCDIVKILYWDKNGFVMHYKRLETGRFKFPKQLMGDYFLINEDQLSWLLAGLDFYLMSQFNQLNFENYF